MQKYTCPMHPEIESDKPGDCLKCGMKLVPKEESARENLTNHEIKKVTLKSYQPLATIIGLILLSSFAAAYHNFSAEKLLTNFMAGFFLVFSAFKFLDLKGFRDGYYTYDLLAKRFYNWGLIYPLIELIFGLGLIINPKSLVLNRAILIVMIFSSLGVLVALIKKREIQCACLGTVIKLPLTYVTLVEDLAMAAMAGFMLTR